MTGLHFPTEAGGIAGVSCAMDTHNLNTTTGSMCHWAAKLEASQDDASTASPRGR
jgi:hypothetical protein